MRRHLPVLLYLWLFVGLSLSCAPLAELFKEPPPCQRATPPAISSVIPPPTLEQQIPVGAGQQIYALYPSTNVPIFAGPKIGDAVIDSHARVCNLYIIIPNEGGIDGAERVYVAQVYLDSDKFVAVFSRSGWIESWRLKKWR